jgi:hypothetical protein
MVGRTKLIRTTGSPLIGGLTRPKRPLLPWIVGAVAAVAVLAGAVWYLFLR